MASNRLFLCVLSLLLACLDRRVEGGQQVCIDTQDLVFSGNIVATGCPPFASVSFCVMNDQIQELLDLEVINGSTILPPCNTSVCTINDRVNAIYALQVINGSTILPPCNVSVCQINTNLGTETTNRILNDIILQARARESSRCLPLTCSRTRLTIWPRATT